MNTNAAAGAANVRIWVAGDLNGFFGLFTNVLLNVIVLTGLCLGVVQLPADTVFGRILPALGIALPLGNLFYVYLAWQLARAEGRTDVTAMPYGPSVPHMFIVVFLIMLPTYLATKNATLAWQARLAWCFIIGVIVLLGAFVGPRIRALTPRAAMLGTLAGISIAFISMRPAFQMWETPWIGLVCFAIVLIAWTANLRMPGGLPGGLVAVIVGTVIGWVVSLVGWSDYVQPAAVAKSLEHFGLRLPAFSNDVWTGLGQIAPLLLAVIPLVAILPILLYIGLVLGAHAFQASPAKHAPAGVLALIPNFAE
jgi:adenine/guanine/hypoxanthine permease